ncbi:hypothetical protein Lal_00041255 [Lupinus albus]|nr:hypothetical protein Lal_00041255 [Lupinus albus]
MQKPRIIEIHVRMDCNGCVQKVKKALNGINGIYDIYIDFPQQKISIIGWADPEKVVKAIKKTRKMATICNIEQPDESPSQPPEPPSLPKEPDQPEGNAQVPESTQPPPPTEAPPPQARPSEEPPKDTPQCEQPQPENNTSHEWFIIGHKHNTNRYLNGPVFLNEQPDKPVYVSQSYNTYRPSPYVTEYEYIRSPPRHHYTHNGNGNITSIFSDENPNACRIV